jgi:ABC-2 type transport system ATP-binding protein
MMVSMTGGLAGDGRRRDEGMAGMGNELAGTDDELAIQASGLTKSYGKHRVLNGVDLRVPRGSVYALLGGNGAGKTTTVRILSTLSRPDGGQVRVAGFDVVTSRHQVRRAISLTGQYAALDETQTGAENLRMMGRLSGLSRRAARARTAELLEQFALTESGRRQVGTYSGGMRRRLDLAASLVGRPSVIFLDEPATGLDLPSRQSMWETVTGLASDGVTIFLTTQYLDEADKLADRIAVLNGGLLVAEGSAAELKQRVAERRLDIQAGSAAGYGSLARSLAGQMVHADPAALTIGVPTDGSAAHVRAVLDRLDPSRQLIRDFAVHDATLDDVFLALTGPAAQHTQHTSEETSSV